MANNKILYIAHSSDEIERAEDYLSRRFPQIRFHSTRTLTEATRILTNGRFKLVVTDAFGGMWEQLRPYEAHYDTLILFTRHSQMGVKAAEKGHPFYHKASFEDGLEQMMGNYFFEFNMTI